MREHGTTQKLDPKKVTIYRFIYIYIYVRLRAALINFKLSKVRKR